MRTHKNVERVLISKEEIHKKVKELAAQIDSEYKDKNPMIICILKGAVLFFTDLIREMQIDCEIEFVAISSYGNNTKSSGQVYLHKDVGTDLEGRHVIIVEDIVDTGKTLAKLKKMFEARGTASIKIATLLDKVARREENVSVDFKCFEIPDEFVIGYGLDYAEQYRNLDCIAIIKSSAVMKQQ